MSKSHDDDRDLENEQKTLLAHLAAAREIANQSGQTTVGYLIEMAITQAKEEQRPRENEPLKN